MALDFGGFEAVRKTPVFSVSQLNRLVADLLEAGCPPLWVSGEISNFTRAASGHWYFTLKDASAQVRCVMFRGRAQSVGFVPREGDKVEARGLPGLYQARGDFQLGVEQMRRAGAGDLYQQFLRIKDRLLAEGLLETARKRALPALPRRVGVITSPQAAACATSTPRARAPGRGRALPDAGSRRRGARRSSQPSGQRAPRRCDVVLLVRGGGSIEDLWAFNDEAVAHRDRRLCDAGDLRSRTRDGCHDRGISWPMSGRRRPPPQPAAVPARVDLLARVAASATRLSQRRERVQQALEQRLDLAGRQLRSPAVYWQERASGLRALAVRLQRAGAVRMDRADDRLRFAASRLREPPVQGAREQLQRLTSRLARGGAAVLALQSDRLDAGAHKLELVSPQSVLARGYSILQRADGEVVRSAGQVTVGEPLQAALADGGLAVQVTGTQRS
jgi:exodeoxyribonuclease VII large subunit